MKTRNPKQLWSNCDRTLLWHAFGGCVKGVVSGLAVCGISARASSFITVGLRRDRWQSEDGGGGGVLTLEGEGQSIRGRDDVDGGARCKYGALNLRRSGGISWK